MKTIAICNHKGGVGKTALSMAIAEGLHRKDKRTLLVDLDQQMNATQQAKIDTTDEVTVYDLLTSFDYTAKDGIKHFDGGDIIPGDVLVSNAESDMAKLDTRLTMLADAMEGIDDDYDYAIIDCPPSLGLVTRNAMVAADELIVPVIPNRSSLKGLPRSVTKTCSKILLYAMSCLRVAVTQKRFATVMPVPCPTMVRTMFELPARRERTLFSIRLSKAVALANRAIGMSSTK